jgi:hypothetical protein
LDYLGSFTDGYINQHIVIWLLVLTIIVMIMSTKSTKHTLLWLVCFLTLLFSNSACKKDEAQLGPEPIPVPVDNERLLLASTFGSGVKNIEYNTDQQPEKFVTAGMSVDVSYDKNRVIYSYVGGKLIMRKVYDIENGLVKTLKEYNYIGGPESETFASSFTYEGGKISKEVLTYGGKLFGYTEYSYDNARENLTVEKTFDHSGNHLTTKTYEYTDSLDKSGSHNEWHRWVDGTLFPKKAKYLVKKSTTDDHFTGKQSVTNYEYVLDELGYVMSGEGTMGNNSVYKWTNTWQ